jgi:signal transduction histidine kinase
MPRLSLTLRTFLFSFLPVCIVLASCFYAVNAAVHHRVQRELREQLQASDLLLDRVNMGWSNRTSALLSKLTDSAGLKAAVGLLAEGRRDPALAAQVRNTIEAQLRELQTSSGFDLLVVADLTGNTVAIAECSGCTGLSSQATIPLQRGLAEVDHLLYQLNPLPINIAGETAAILVLGTRFDLGRLALPGDAVLLRSGKVLASTLSRGQDQRLEQQIAARCGAFESACEASLGGQTYVVSRLQKTQIGPGYRLLGFRSLDAPVRDFTESFLGTLISIAIAGVLLALLCTIFTSRSVSRPLRALVAQLNHTEASGDLSERLTAGRAVRELALLADAYNRVADSAQRTRRQLEIAKDAAQSANRLKDEFLTNVSHELRTPLNGVLGMTDLLLQTPLDADQQDFAATVRTSGETLVAIIDDILTFSQLQTGRLTLNAQPFDFEKLLSESSRWTAQQAEAKRIRVEMCYPHASPRMFRGDEMQVRRILRHLCDNAVKFTDAGSIRISFECGLESQAAIARVTVVDTGIGIASNAHGLVFERFTQTDGSLTRQRGGTGLGLALVKSLATLMGGHAGVESEAGKGSRFWFAVPLQPLEQTFEAEQAAVPETGRVAC